MVLLDLYQFAESKKITVDCFALNNTECLSIVENGQFYIAIDPFALQSTQEEFVKLAHEIGHCETGCYYNFNTPLWLRRKYERSANRWAIKKLIPRDELEKAFQKGYTEVWELAEQFNVTEDFIRIAAKEYGLLQ